MECFYCGKEFKIKPTGTPGGGNRILCYNCLPEGVPKEKVINRAYYLTMRKIKEDKEKIGCSICGYNKNGTALEWHHINSEEKDKNPAEYLRESNGYSKYLEETKKCILLCANCHREIHNPKQPLEVLVGTDDAENLRQKVVKIYQEQGTLKAVSDETGLKSMAIISILDYYGIKHSAYPSQLGIYQLNKDTNEIIAEYPSARAAATAMGSIGQRDHIKEVCRGKRKTACGYKWKFIE